MICLQPLKKNQCRTTSLLLNGKKVSSKACHQCTMSTLTQAIVVPAVIGACLCFSNALLIQIYSNYISPQLFSSVTINNSEIDHFDAVLEFIEKEKSIHANHLVLCEDLLNLSGDREKLNSIHYEPANTGELLSVKHEGRTVYVKRVKDSSDAQQDLCKFVQKEKLLISVLGPDPSAIKSLISSAIQHKDKKISKTTCVYISNEQWVDRWNKIMEGPPRTMESVILNKRGSHDVLQDMCTFIASKEWYTSMGIPYRRGYLFYGPPGNGKTSLCLAFAGELNLDICILSLSCPNLTDSKLTGILRRAPGRSVILLEDVDAAFVMREKSDDASSKLTFSGLINAIDGAVSQEGHIFIMTTNHIEKLDPALIRPGRCDVKLEVSNASCDQLESMFVRFFPGREADARIYASRIPENEISMAQIQNHLVANKSSPEKAIETAALLKAEI